MEKLSGYVDHIIFRNDENGYTVFQMHCQGKDLTCVGSIPHIHEGENVELSGEYGSHPVYGEQFLVEEYTEKEPDDIESIERYLGSGAIKGIGEALASRIVKKFQEDTFRIVEEEPERLAEIKGISENKARDIGSQVAQKRGARRATIELQKLGLSLHMATKIYEYYGTNFYTVLEKNPYQLAEDIEGIGFLSADEIAYKLGIERNSDFRLLSGIYFTLAQCVNEGHVYLHKEELLSRASNLLEVELSNFEQLLLVLTMERKIIVKEYEKEGKRKQERIYPSTLYFTELKAAQKLTDLNVSYNVKEARIDKYIENIEIEEKITLDAMQKTAIRKAMQRGVLVLSGGPGTGKTTTINSMIQMFDLEKLEFVLAAPTGRAAKRMTEATGYHATTIHRLLEVSGFMGGPSEKGSFGRNDENPLDVDVVIIDEVSMVDISLFHALLDAIPLGTRLVLVGDENQLPSVGPGSVLKDVIASNKIAVVTLSKIFRQASESAIVVNAHKINQGEMLSLENNSKDFFFIRREEANHVIKVMMELMQDKLPTYVNASPLEVQVITPTRKGVLGVERLNVVLQDYLNPPDPSKGELNHGGRIFRKGDKVMQVKNNYQLEWSVETKKGFAVEQGAGIFNGDIGVVSEIGSQKEEILVIFDEGKRVWYPLASLVELEHAYAITIHKSQGSEYPAVIIPILSGPEQLFYRNLLYTAVTRAKSCVTIVGSESKLQEMIRNHREQHRNTSLWERIIECHE